MNGSHTAEHGPFRCVSTFLVHVEEVRNRQLLDYYLIQSDIMCISQPLAKELAMWYEGDAWT